MQISDSKTSKTFSIRFKIWGLWRPFFAPFHYSALLNTVRFGGFSTKFNKAKEVLFLYHAPHELNWTTRSQTCWVSSVTLMQNVTITSVRIQNHRQPLYFFDIYSAFVTVEHPFLYEISFQCWKCYIPISAAAWFIPVPPIRLIVHRLAVFLFLIVVELNWIELNF